MCENCKGHRDTVGYTITVQGMDLPLDLDWAYHDEPDTDVMTLRDASSKGRPVIGTVSFYGDTLIAVDEFNPNKPSDKLVSVLHTKQPVEVLPVYNTLHAFIEAWLLDLEAVAA